MSKNILLKTNLFVCIVILVGFALTALQNYNSTRRLYMDNMEHVSSLTTEGIYYRLESIFAKPVNVSLTMANDNFLIDFLAEETEQLDNDEYVQTMSEYLEAYRDKYDYDSVFLVSTNTHRYYNFSGIDRVLSKDSDENDWYFNFVESGAVCALNVDNDEAAENEITVFINCAIKDKSGTIGVVGVGFRIDNLQALLYEYERQFDVQTFLINEQGFVEISTDLSGYEYVDHFSISGYPQLKDEILSEKGETRSYWIEEESGRNFIVAQYIPDMSWYLIVENNTRILDEKMQFQILSDLLIVTIIVLVALIVITVVIRGFKKNIEQLTEEHLLAFRQATEELFDNIYEINITDNMPVGKSAINYFKSLGLTENTSYSDALLTIAYTQIKPEHKEEYIRIFSPENILNEFQNGVTSLRYEFQSNIDGKSYKWLRINANIYRNKADNSVRAFMYRQNIETEKRAEIQARTDSLTGLFNKLTTERYIRQLLTEGRDLFGFVIFDIDDFKLINDNFGHSCGDEAIVRFSNALRKRFRRSDIVGRIGGDEFVVFLPIPSVEWVKKIAEEFAKSLDIEFKNEEASIKIATSIGISIFPQHGTDFETLYRNADAALYKTKEQGKNGVTIFNETNWHNL